MLGWRGWTGAGIAVLAALVAAFLLMAGGGSHQRPPSSFHIGRLHPGSGAGAGVAAGGVDQLLGANSHPLWTSQTIDESDRELDLLKQAGADVVRIDLSWTSLETAGKGQYSQWYVDKTDEFLQHAKDKGIKVIATLWSTPCWASTAPDDLKQGCTGDWWNRGVDHYPPADPADYGDIAGAVAAHWGDKLYAIEIWNEPNLGDTLRTSDPAAADAALIKAAYPRIKAAAPWVKVLAGSLAYSDGDFLNKLYDDGIQGYFDGLAIHPYSQWRDPSDPWQPQYREWTYLTGVPWIESILDAHGDGDKGVWLTELGWSSCLPGGTDSWCVTQEQQAQYVTSALRIAASWPYVKAVVIYNLRDTGTDPNDRESQFGLIDRDFTPKPAYAAFQQAISGPVPSQDGTDTATTTAPSSPAPTDKPSAPDTSQPPVTLPADAAPRPVSGATPAQLEPSAASLRARKKARCTRRHGRRHCRRLTHKHG